MCCFSVASPTGWFSRIRAALTPQVRVSATNIFARRVTQDTQALAYGMDLDARQAIAMVLPLPVAPGSGEDAVTFVDLTRHPRMFQDWQRMFEAPMPLMRKGGPSLPYGAAAKTLVVHTVGSFVASYVPTRADFTRLDPRFRMPNVLFDAVPAYSDYGFAVFQLETGKTTVHPMAMTFLTREPDRLFFPTVHIHDGHFKKTAKFDHALYYQTLRCTGLGETTPHGEFEGDAVGWLAPDDSHEGLVVPQQAMLRRTLRQRLPNQDTWIAA